MAFLAPETLDLGNRHAGHPDLAERIAHIVEFERLDDGGDQFHATGPLSLVNWNPQINADRRSFSSQAA
jgi:hypothetical protein